MFLFGCGSLQMCHIIGGRARFSIQLAAAGDVVLSFRPRGVGEAAGAALWHFKSCNWVLSKAESRPIMTYLVGGMVKRRYQDKDQFF